MKVSPIAQGTGVPAQSDTSGKSVAPDTRARAIAIASGQEPEAPQPTGDAQVDRINTKRIKMNTQQSTNRHESPVAEVVEQVLESPTTDTVEPAQVEEETKPLSPQFAALARQKRALQVKERELAQREQALTAQPVQAGGISLEKLKADPLGVLQGAGVTYDQLTEAILNNDPSSIDPQKLRMEIKEELKKELLGEFSTRDQLAEKQVLGEIKREAIELVSNNENYEAINAARAQDTVVDLIHRTWKETGEVLDVTTAAELVENQLLDEALPFARLKKVQSRLTPAQEEQVEQTPPPQRPGTKVMRTLTNRDNATPMLDRRSRAIAAMLGTLKKG